MADNNMGLMVSGYVRDLLVAHRLCDYNTAVQISQEFDKMAIESDWLELYNGTTFTKTFTPSYFKEMKLTEIEHAQLSESGGTSVVCQDRECAQCNCDLGGGTCNTCFRSSQGDNMCGTCGDFMPMEGSLRICPKL